MRFPEGVFPWLRVDIEETEKGLLVSLPDCPAVQAQFAASLKKAVVQGSRVAVPSAARTAVYAWLSAVKGTGKMRNGQGTESRKGGGP